MNSISMENALAKARGEEPVPAPKVEYSKHERSTANDILANLLDKKAPVAKEDPDV